MNGPAHELLARVVAVRLATWSARPSQAYVLTWGRMRLLVGIA